MKIRYVDLRGAVIAVGLGRVLPRVGDVVAIDRAEDNASAPAERWFVREVCIPLYLDRIGGDVRVCDPGTRWRKPFMVVLELESASQ
jgi:hypothetical protein